MPKKQSQKMRKRMLKFEKRVETIEGKLSLIIDGLKKYGIIVLEPEENQPNQQNENESTEATSDQQNAENEMKDQQEQDDVKTHIIHVHKQEVESHSEELLENNFVVATYDGSNDIVVESVKLEDKLGNVQGPCGVYQCLEDENCDSDDRIFQNNGVVLNGVDEHAVDQENVRQQNGENVENGDEEHIDNSTEEISILYEQVQDIISPKKKKKVKVGKEKEFNATSSKSKVIKKKTRKCKKCSKIFVALKKFKIHREICTATIKCCFIACDKVFINEEYLRKHQRREHRIAIVDSVKCKFCNQYFLYKKNMKTHIIEVHDKNKDFPCYICKISFNDKSAALAHIKKLHQKKIEKSNGILNKRKPKIKKIRYKCLKCFAGFFNKIAFMNHLKKMKCKKIVAQDCLICKRRFRTKKGLRIHTTTLHKDSKKKLMKSKDSKKKNLKKTDRENSSADARKKIS